ncbi:photosystem II reaction center 13 kDa protein [Lyngbya sp. PCC 8106]|nr:photosystem II reaction center 13 kDa protein [Lyngbya sp. PCC 8106]
MPLAFYDGGWKFNNCLKSVRNIMATIQFAKGIDEDVIPNVRLTRSRDNTQGTATFYFDNPKALANDFAEEITGMYLIDEEGELLTREVKAKFVNGKPEAIEAFYLMQSEEEWNRFMRFMNRYAEANGLEFSKS